MTNAEAAAMRAFEAGYLRLAREVIRRMREASEPEGVVWANAPGVIADTPPDPPLEWMPKSSAGHET